MRHITVLFVSLLVAACGASDSGGNASATAVPVGNDGTTGDFSTAASTGAFLFAGSYTMWRVEPAIHDSAGPHGGGVRSYYNDKYADAWNADSFPMPVGSMSVKELYDGMEIDGWAAAIKTSEGSGKDTWTWYEVLNANKDPMDYDFFGVAHPTCEGCHSGSMKDYSLAPNIP